MSIRLVRNAIAAFAIISLAAGTMLGPNLALAKGGGGGGGGVGGGGGGSGMSGGGSGGGGGASARRGRSAFLIPARVQDCTDGHLLASSWGLGAHRKNGQLNSPKFTGSAFLHRHCSGLPGTWKHRDPQSGLSAAGFRKASADPSFCCAKKDRAAYATGQARAAMAAPPSGLRRYRKHKA
jgi:hypothetical protein